MIEYTVGQGAKNETRDVSWIQGRLNLCQKQIEVIVTGKWDSRTEAATEYIQGRYLGMSPTGKIFPNDATAILLERSGKECMAPLDTARLPPVGSGAEISQDDFEAASKKLRVAVAVIRAVTSVESRGRGFGSDGRPTVLYEPHLFSRLTARKYDEASPHLSSKSWNRSLYNIGGSSYEKLVIATALNRSAAFQACSWGSFQILGMNYRLCGFSSVEAMVAAMFVNERAHLNAFVEFILSRKLDSMLRAHDWIGFARAYNGPMFHSNQYDYKLKTAYERYSQKKLAKEIAR